MASAIFACVSGWQIVLQESCGTKSENIFHTLCYHKMDNEVQKRLPLLYVTKTKIDKVKQQ